MDEREIEAKREKEGTHLDINDHGGIIDATNPSLISRFPIPTRLGLKLFAINGAARDRLGF